MSEWIGEARRSAQHLLHRFGVQEPEHILVEAFARRLGLEVVEVRLDGAAAQLVLTATRAIIMVSDRITDPAARRFSIAHELGHFVLGHPSRPPAELCAPSRFGGARDYEAEANAFAAELLMPARLLQRSCEVAPVDLSVPRDIARRYEVSILASTIRFAELATERCAAVFSAAGAIKWVASSPTFTYAIERGRRLGRSSLASEYFTRGAIPDQPTRVPADAWLPTADVDIVEHSICSPELGTVLTMLWIPKRSAGDHREI